MSKNKKILLRKTASIVMSLAFIALLATPALFTQTTYAQSGMEPVSWGTGYAAEVGLPQDDIRSIIVRIIKALLGFLGVVALIIILIGGVEWMTAGGNDDKVKTAQKRIGYGVIGIVIIFISYALTTFIFDTLFQAASDYGTYVP